MGMRKLATAVSLALGAAMWGAAAQAKELLGQPTPGGIGLQPAGSEFKEAAHFFHDGILMPIITAICVLVLGLLIWVVVRFNKRANPTPARWSHNTAIEVLWTVVPVLILMFIAIYSFRLLFQFHDLPKPDVVVKVTGYQWYWGYEYPDHGVDEITSTLLPKEEAAAKGEPYLLGVDNPMVVPVGKNVRVVVTGQDVIHAFGVPAFGFVVDAVPGRVNEIGFKADRVGKYYGNCRELCGVDHAYMPIQINVVTQAEFDAWVAAQGGSTPAVGGAPAAAAQGATGTVVSAGDATVPAPAAAGAAVQAPAPATKAPPAGKTEQPGPAGATPAPKAQ